jgi:hypothetical protein
MMANPVLSDDAVWKRVEENRLRAERVREPYLVVFRATPEEIALRTAEDAQEAALPDEPFAHWAEQIARAAREGVRFERYLVRQGFYPNIPKDHPLGRG